MSELEIEGKVESNKTSFNQGSIKMSLISNYDKVGNPSARKMKTTEERVAQELAKDFVYYKLGKGTRLNTKTATLLRKLSKEIEKKHEPLFKNMCDRLNLNERTVDQTFLDIADEILGKDINWGRIVALYTFAGRVTVYFDEHDVQIGDEIAVCLGNYVAGKSEWIRKAGGWVSELSFYSNTSCLCR